MEKTTGKFRFKGYEFQVNPARFQISGSRNLKLFQSPLCKPVTQDLGFNPLRITGEGELFGSDVMGEYQKLYKVYREESSGILFLPNMKPFYCFFDHLSITGQAGPQILKYEFSFTEDCQKNNETIANIQSYYVAKKGDTLYSIGLKCNISIVRLMEKNPRLSAMQELEEGTIVWLS